jgi:hypothetical protein
MLYVVWEVQLTPVDQPFELVTLDHKQAGVEYLRYSKQRSDVALAYHVQRPECEHKH